MKQKLKSVEVEKFEINWFKSTSIRLNPLKIKTTKYFKKQTDLSQFKTNFDRFFFQLGSILIDFKLIQMNINIC